MAVDTITKKQLRQIVCGASGLNGLFTGTVTNATDGTVVVDGQTLVDQSSVGIKDTAYDASRFKNAWVLLDYTTPEVHRVVDYSSDAGSITIGRTWGTTPTSGSTAYEVHTHGLDPITQLDRAINWVCENSRYEDYIVLCGLADPDGSMDASTVDSAWTGTNCALTKTLIDGRYSLHTVNSSANGYAGKTVAVGGETTGLPSYKVFATVKATSGTANVVVQDLTNGTAITVQWNDVTAGVAATTTGDWVTLYGTFALPSGCVSISLRLQNSSATGTSDWKDVGLHRLDAEGHTLPNWLDNPEHQIAGVYGRTRLGTLDPIISPPKYRGRLIPLRPTDWPSIPVLHVGRPFGAPSTDATTLPKWAEKWLVAGALAECYKMLSRPGTKDSTAFAVEYQRALQRWVNQGTQFDPVLRYGRPRWSLART